MSGTCSQGHCNWPETECARGETNIAKCPHWSQQQAPVNSKTPKPKGNDFPWTGNTLGTDDLSWVSARRRPKLYAPIGAQNAGKTTFLLAAYLGICRGHGFGDLEFAGSYTLGGWEHLAAYARYQPTGVGPSFPPHTPLTATSAPGLLHLSLRHKQGGLDDLALADAPGEWFTSWAVDEETPFTGARWLVDRADGFIFFVDTDALHGAERGAARDKIYKLAQRLAPHLGLRPVAILWTKSDVEISAAMKEQVNERLSTIFPAARSFSASVKSAGPEKEFIQVLEWLLQQNGPPIRPALELDQLGDRFFSYRGH